MINSGQGRKERTHPIKLQTPVSERISECTAVDAGGRMGGVVNSGHAGGKQLTCTWMIISGCWRTQLRNFGAIFSERTQKCATSRACLSRNVPCESSRHWGFVRWRAVLAARCAVWLAAPVPPGLVQSLPASDDRTDSQPACSQCRTATGKLLDALTDGGLKKI